ncbi:MAG: transcription termination factor NusA [Minisyncoccales bacterium]
MDIKNFLLAVNQIAEEKGIPREKVLESIEAAIATAYKKDYGKKGQIIKAKLNQETGEVKFWQVKEVVSPEMLYSEEELAKLKKMPATEGKKKEKIRFLPEKHILLEEAKKINPRIKPGEQLEIPLTTKEEYGRIAAQTAKQVILQKIREAEKESIFTEYKQKEGEIVSGLVQRVEAKNIYLDIGKTLGVLPKEEQVPGEFYRPGQRLKVYILKVEEMPRGPIVVLSRAYPKLISKLFELEVPEIAAGQVVIKSIAREPGSRSKIAVSAAAEGIDPVGSLVGQKGTRVMAVINELGGEKIDIIEYSDDPQKYVANALAPAKPIEVKIMPKNKALVIVPNDQLSLAIGKNGQNVRLAAKLTGWKIDVKTDEGLTLETTLDETEVQAEAEAEAESEKTAEAEEKPATKKKRSKSKK